MAEKKKPEEKKEVLPLESFLKLGTQGAEALEAGIKFLGESGFLGTKRQEFEKKKPK